MNTKLLLPQEWVMALMQDALQISTEECVSKYNPYWFKRALADTLSSREQKILRYRYRDQMTFTEIGEQLNLSRERVRVIQNNAISKLLDPKIKRRYVCIPLVDFDFIKRHMEMYRAQLIQYPNRYREGDAAGYPSIKALCFPPCITTALTKNGIKTTQELLVLTRKDLMKIPGIGKQRADFIESTLREFGLSLLPNESIDELGLQKRTERALIKAGIDTIEKARVLSRNELVKIQGLGVKGRNDLEMAIEKLGLPLTQEIMR